MPSIIRLRVEYRDVFASCKHNVWLQAAEQEAQATLRAAHAQAESAAEELHAATTAAAAAQAELASLRGELSVATTAARDGASAVRTARRVY